MNEQRIREIANQSSTYAENSVDYYSGTDDGLTWEAKILKARDLKFAELIVKECATAMNNMPRYARTPITKDIENATIEDCINAVKNHFGVEE